MLGKLVIGRAAQGEEPSSALEHGELGRDGVVTECVDNGVDGGVCEHWPCAGRGRGTSRTTTSSVLPYLSIWAAFMGFSCPGRAVSCCNRKNNTVNLRWL